LPELLGQVKVRPFDPRMQDKGFAFSKSILPSSSKKFSSTSRFTTFPIIREKSNNDTETVTLIKIPQTEIPEFPSIALPVASILGLIFVVQYRKKQ